MLICTETVHVWNYSFFGKKRDDPISSVVPWGSAEIETGLKGLAPCIGGGCLCYVHDVLDLSKENRDWSRRCLLHLHELHDSCSFSKNSTWKEAVEKQKKQTVGLKAKEPIWMQH